MAVGFRYGANTTWCYSAQEVGNLYLIDDTDQVDAIYLPYGALWSSSQTKFGTASLKLPASAYVPLPQEFNYIETMEDFTLEYWIYPLQATSHHVKFSSTSTDSGAAITITQSGGSITFCGTTVNLSMDTDAWRHVAICRSGGVTRLFVDGVLRASVVNTYQQTLVSIGAQGVSGNIAYFDSLGLGIGYAYYQTGFAVPDTPFYTAPTTTGAVSTCLIEFVPCEANGTLITPVEADPLWDSVMFHIRGGGLNGSTDIRDVKGHPVASRFATIAANRTKHVGSSVFVGGNDSGDEQAGVVVGVHSSFVSLHARDFTIEGWFYVENNSIEQCLISTGLTWSLYISASGVLTFKFRAFINGSNVDRTVTAGTVSAHEWFHAAVTREADEYRVYLNGISGTALVTPDPPKDETFFVAEHNGVSTGTCNSPVVIGAYNANLMFSSTSRKVLRGNFEDVRLTIGTARYTGAMFTPPSAFLPHFDTGAPGDTYWDDVVLLAHLDEPEGTVYNLRDAKNHSLNVVGTGYTTAGLYWSTTDRDEMYPERMGFFGNYYRTSGNSYVETPSHADFDLSYGDFTLEAWVYHNRTDGSILRRQTGTSGYSLEVKAVSGESSACGVRGYYLWRQWGPSGIEEQVVGPFNAAYSFAWQHVAVVRRSGELSVYVDGVRGTPYTPTEYPANPDVSVVIGGQPVNGANQVSGICEVRMTRAARYSGDFTPAWERFTEQKLNVGGAIISETYVLIPGSPKSAATVDGAVITHTYSLFLPLIVGAVIDFGVSVSAAGAATGGEGAQDGVHFEDDLIARQAAALTSAFSVAVAASAAQNKVLYDLFSVSDLSQLRFGATVAEEQVAFVADALVQAVMRYSMTEQIGYRADHVLALSTQLADTAQFVSAMVFGRGATVAERVGLADTATGVQTLNVVLVSEVALADALARYVGVDVSDGMGFSESVTRAAVRALLAQDGLAISDAPDVLTMVYAVANESLAMADSVTPAQVLSALVQERFAVAAFFAVPGTTAWAVNTRMGAVTEYRAFQFNSFCQLGNRYLGASDTGLYWLDGEGDVEASVKTGALQPFAETMAGVDYAYIGMRGDGRMVATVADEQGHAYDYPVDVDSMRTARVQFGKGFKSRYFTLKIATDVDFDLDRIEFLIRKAARKVFQR